MKKFLILYLILIFLPVISAAETINGLDVEWDSSTDYTLSWTNPAITKGDYVIKVIDFNWKGDAVVSVTRNGETQKGVLSQGVNSDFNFTKNTVYFQGVRIYPKTVSNYLPFPTNIGTYPCCPAAQITVSISKAIAQKIPALELILTPNWDGNLDSISVMNLQIKNTGDASFSEGNITIDVNGLNIANEQELSDQALVYNPSRGTVIRGWKTPLLAGNYYSINLSIKSPIPSKKSTFTISVNSYFKDSTGKIYSAAKSETVSLNPTINLKKSISSSTILGSNIYGGNEIDIGFLPKVFGLSKITVVNIYIKNIQSFPVKSIILSDTIIESFGLVNNSISPTQGFRLIDNKNKLEWVFDLNASETKEFRYEMNAQKTGSFTAPAAVAQWNEWGAPKTKSSDQPATRVYGVFVVVSKKTDKLAFNLKERLNVTTVLENIGDFPVGINVTDILPENATFISGNTSYSGFLYPKESVSLTYTLSEDKPGELELPSPQVTFWRKEYEGSYGFIPAKNVTAIEPSVVLPANATSLSQNITSTPAETPLSKSLLEIMGAKAPWLEGAIPIIMLFIAIILMLLLHVINRRP